MAGSSEAGTIRARHAAYYRDLAEDANERLRAATAPAWRERLNSDLANLKAALDWHVATGNADAALSMASGMAWLWFINGDFTEGARWLASALAADGARRPELQAPARNEVSGPRILGHIERVLVTHVDDGGADFDPARPCTNGGEERERR